MSKTVQPMTDEQIAKDFGRRSVGLTVEAVLRRGRAAALTVQAPTPAEGETPAQTHLRSVERALHAMADAVRLLAWDATCAAIDAGALSDGGGAADLQPPKARREKPAS